LITFIYFIHLLVPFHQIIWRKWNKLLEIKAKLLACSLIHLMWYAHLHLQLYKLQTYSVKRIYTLEGGQSGRNIQWIYYIYIKPREYCRRDPSRWPRGTLYPHKLATSSPTSGGRSVGIVRSRTQTMEFSLVIYILTVCLFIYIYIYIGKQFRIVTTAARTERKRDGYIGYWSRRWQKCHFTHVQKTIV
jgi:hypothetical protein